MKNVDLERVVALLERATTDAIAGGMISVSIELVDTDGTAWLYRHAAGTTPARDVGPWARIAGPADGRVQ